MRGAFVVGVPSTGTAHATTPGNYDMIVDLPEEIVSDAKAAVILANHNQSQEVYQGWVGRNGNYQYGHHVWFMREKGTKPERYYIMSNSYDAAKRMCSIVLTKYLIIPKHESTQPLDNRQLISNTENRVTWVDDAPVEATPDFDETDLTDDLLWNDLDISSIVGAKRVRVQINLHGTDNVAGSEIWVRPNGDAIDRPNVLYADVAGKESLSIFCVTTDASGIIEIKTDPKPTSWTEIEIYIMDHREE
jgi:hypothetical protein